MTKTITILAVILIGFGIQSAYACTEENIEHWDKVVFTVNVDLDTETPDIPPLLKADREYDIKFKETPEEVASITDLKKKVQQRLASLGYGSTFTPQIFSNPDAVNIIDVEYSIICNDDFGSMIGGILLQPDATALFIAYGIANAIWLAPTVAGLGVGIYLTKSKWKR